MRMLLTDKNDIKLFIMYLLMNVGYPLDFETISEIVIHDDFVKYIDFAEAFTELLDSGYVEESAGGTKSNLKYRISETGQSIAVQLQNKINIDVREESLRSALRILSFKSRGAEIKCHSEARRDGRYDLVCGIIEGGEPLMEIKLIIDDTDRLEKMKKNFQERPETIYKGLLAIVAGDVNYLF